MFKRKTVFVVGAGASTEVGLPMGRGLKDDIAKRLNIKFIDMGPRHTGDEDIVTAIRAHCRSADPVINDINPYREAAVQISASMPLAISIDNYLHAHAGDARVELCGKLAIAAGILRAERNSLLWCNPRENLPINKIEKSWYLPFFQLVTENVQRRQVDHVLDNVAIVTFNYDRCIETFLVQALMIYYKMSSDSAAEIVNRATIIHPYGQVGRLSWQSDPFVDFGSEFDGWKLLTVAGQIRTFTEQRHDVDSLLKIRQVMSEAETAIFLGFAFHELNVKLLEAGENRRVSRVFGTAYRMSESDVETSVAEVRGALMDPGKQRDFKLDDVTCNELFYRYWRTLPK